MLKISIIGVGRVGGALGIALSRKGFEIENLFVRNDETAKKVSEIIEPKPQILSSGNFTEISSEIVLITTRDSEIEQTAKDLAGRLKKSRPAVFHTSGSLSSEVLKPLKEIGCRTGSIHPLVSISDAVLGVERFKDAFFCIEGEPEAVELAKKIVADLGGKAFSIETKYKTLYHASAVTASGHLLSVIDVAIEMLEKCGLDGNSAKEILLPLIKSTFDNLEVQTPAESLTGPFARADLKTIERHLAVLNENVSGQIREIYLQLGERSVHLAEEQGADAENLRKIRNKISLAKKNFKC